MSTYEYHLIGKKHVLIDDEYNPNDILIKDKEKIGQKIDIKGIDKSHLASRLYLNLMGNNFQELELIEMLHFFKLRGYKMESYKWTNLNLNLSGDVFDPEKYDAANDTYSRAGVLTAYQCVTKLKNDLEHARVIYETLSHSIKQFLKRDDIKLHAQDNYEITFAKELSIQELRKIADSFADQGLAAYPKSPETWRHHPKPGRILIKGEYKEILDLLLFPRNDTEAARNRKFWSS